MSATVPNLLPLELGRVVNGVPISPLSLDQLTRDYWGQFDAYAIAQLAPLASSRCYRPKIYRAPSVPDEVVGPLQYVPYGLSITPGSLIYGIYNPVHPTNGVSAAFAPTAANYRVQVTDTSQMRGDRSRTLFDEPVPAQLISNCKPNYLDPWQSQVGSFPYLLQGPYPVVGSGIFRVGIWSTDDTNSQRIEFVLGVFEVCEQ